MGGSFIGTPSPSCLKCGLPVEDLSFKRQGNAKITVGFDVDGTLIRAHDDSPRYSIIELFDKFQKLGCWMVIASGGGVPYAARWAEKLGLIAEIWPKEKLQEADIVFDDETNQLGKVGIYV